MMTLSLRRKALLFIAMQGLLAISSFAGGADEQIKGISGVFALSNDVIHCAITVNDGKLVSEIIRLQPDWLKKFNKNLHILQTDGDFGLEVMWTGWRAPGKSNNAENPVTLTSKDFSVIDTSRLINESANELSLILKGLNNPFNVRLSYQLEPGAFYIRRRLDINDERGEGHFLQKMMARNSRIIGDISIIKTGGFGQPIAIELMNGGAFFGMEYPASDNAIEKTTGIHQIVCIQEIGEVVGKSRITSDWVVTGLTPDKYVRQWFFKYLDNIRVSRLKPYTLYNSWYDLRSPEISPDPVNIMNEINVKSIIEKLRKNMIERYDIKLDAFVLDDGWDIYKSDWVLREKEFPNGLKPIAEELMKTGIDLGLWFGPIGGYSKRTWRVGWMKEHGYELVGDQLCLAGQKYKELFKKRVLDFIINDGVGYYKWDGIQFSCSERDHGHAIGIYSRRAVMNTLIDLCQAVRKAKSDIFLNITSGTWLSPWWVKYTNQIWMGGYDYSYSDVPSISKRDSAMTYRDLVLYEDFIIEDFWFPIANLMTHGIIKGYLQKLGGEDEPVDKFTDNALLYFARGVSMWELYISPDILSDGEWDAIARSIKWAKDRFDILSNTVMIGGNPRKREAYGYAHFDGKRGIIAARNPFIESSILNITLDRSIGLDDNAISLVIERTYPNRWISPNLYNAGEVLTIPLEGYETAIYEIYPLKEAKFPLLAGAVFDSEITSDNQYEISVYEKTGHIKMLNPSEVVSISMNGDSISPDVIQDSLCVNNTDIVRRKADVKEEDGSTVILTEISLSESVSKPMLAVLLEPDDKTEKKPMPELTATGNGKNIQSKIGATDGDFWAWRLLPLEQGNNTTEIGFSKESGSRSWCGNASLWLIYNSKCQPLKVTINAKKRLIPYPMPPKSFPSGEKRVNIKLGDFSISGFSDVKSE